MKKNGDLRIIHDLQQLNSVLVMDSGVPPILDEFIESFAGRAVYSVLDMYWGFYTRIVDPKSRDMTTFQTPLGELQVVFLSMGYTNSPAESQAYIHLAVKFLKRWESSLMTSLSKC